MAGLGSPPAAIATVARVRGHSPREVGASLVIYPSGEFGTVGGGELERLARRELLNPTVPRTAEYRLTGPGQQWVQCCGGEVTLLYRWLPAGQAQALVGAGLVTDLVTGEIGVVAPKKSRLEAGKFFESFPQLPVVAVFGAGHVGQALIQVLLTLEIELIWVATQKPVATGGGVAEFKAIAAPIPESVISELPPGASVVIMTQDHALDLAILEAALLRPELGYLGLIGSRVKALRFQAQLESDGIPQELWRRVKTPIGIAGISGKDPGSIAVATAAELLLYWAVTREVNQQNSGDNQTNSQNRLPAESIVIDEVTQDRD